jgi:ABC-type multidrug transport system fused ATPase/permease subunit
MSGVMNLAMVALIYMSSVLYFNYDFSVGKINSFNSYMFSVLINLAMLSTVITEVFGMYGTTMAIADINLYREKISINGGDNVSEATITDGSVNLENITFNYPTKEDSTVIKGATIKVAKNKTVALVGSSGCGKSTIIQLIERFYDPIGGMVRYGNQDLKSLNPVSYKGAVAIVQQEPVLFSGTINDNITYGLSTMPS